jgi:hypothetical protein
LNQREQQGRWLTRTCGVLCTGMQDSVTHSAGASRTDAGV